MFKSFKEKIFMKELTKILNYLETINYSELKHEILKIKWEALKENNDDLYSFSEMVYNVSEELEKYVEKGGRFINE